MGNRYWVGGTANWDGTAGSKWALTSGGAGGQAAPTSDDDVYIDAVSNANTITVSNYVSCKKLDFKNSSGGGFTGSFSCGGFGLSIYGDLIMNYGMTALGNSTWAMKGASPTVTTDEVPFAGGGVDFQHGGTATVTGTLIYSTGGYGPFFRGGHVNFSGNISINGGSITHTNGTIDFGDGDIGTVTTFDSTGATTRAIVLGSNAITMTGAINFTGSNLTFTCGTSSIVITDTYILTFMGAGKTFYDVEFKGTTYEVYINGANTFHDLKFTPTTTKKLMVLCGVSQTVTGVCLYNGTAWVPFILPSGKAMTSPASDDYSPALFTTAITLSVVVNGVDNVYAQINDKVIALTNTGGDNWSVTVYAGYFGACSTQVIYFTARTDTEDYGFAHTTSTITIPAITAKSNTLLTEVAADLATHGITATVSLIGEEEVDGDIRSLVKIVVATYSVNTIDAIRTQVAAHVSGWSGTVTAVEYSAPVNATSSVVIYKMSHT